jgi:DNA-binding HxlR family transcriptional regulator
MAGDLCVRFHQAVELIGRRWSGAVIQLLMQHRLRYAELRAAIPDISDRMLSERLRELEAAGIVVRTVLPDPPVRVEYDLTEKGRALKPALMAIGEWAERWVTAGVPLPAIAGADAAKASTRAPAAARTTGSAPAAAARVATAAPTSRTSPATATRTSPAGARTSAASSTTAATASNDRLRKRRVTTSSR